MVLYTVRGIAAAHVSWPCGTALEGGPTESRRGEHWAARTHTPARLSGHPRQRSWETGLDYKQALILYCSEGTFTAC